jgi:hypothetical protein
MNADPNRGRPQIWKSLPFIFYAQRSPRGSTREDEDGRLSTGDYTQLTANDRSVERGIRMDVFASFFHPPMKLLNPSVGIRKVRLDQFANTAPSRIDLILEE